MGRIPVSLTEILRRYSFSYTQLRRDVVPHKMHGALRAPPNEADLGPARFWAGVHRRERCGPESDGGQLARRLVVRCARWPAGPGALLPRARSRRQPLRVARAAVAKRGGRGSPPCRPGPRPRACETNKKALQRFHAAKFDRFYGSFLRADGSLVSSEASGVARTRPGAGSGTCQPRRPLLPSTAAPWGSLGSLRYTKKQH